jgi:hypothetical protein
MYDKRHDIVPVDIASLVCTWDRDTRGLGHLWHLSGGGSMLSLSRLCTYPGWWVFIGMTSLHQLLRDGLL